MNLAKIATRYAKAFAETAEEKNILDAVYADFKQLKTLFNDSEELRSLIHSPTIQLSKKDSILSEILSGNVNDLTLTFFRLLIQKNRLELIIDCIEQFERLMDLKAGIVHAHVTSSVQLSDSQLTGIKRGLEAQLTVQIVLSSSTDESLIGGYTVRVNDTLIDHTVKNQLSKLKSSLLAG